MEPQAGLGLSPHLASERLRTAEHELRDAVRDGRARDAAAWRIAVDVLRHYAGQYGAPSGLVIDLSARPAS